MKSITKNKKAYFSYTILEKHIAGIQLQGSEVKSIKASKVSIAEAYCYIKDGEIFIKGMYVSLYSFGAQHNNHEPVRDRKLLLKKKEIVKLSDKVSQKGLTIVPLELMVNDTGLIKLEIGLVKGKNTFDKKEVIKLRDLDRDLKRNL